MVFGLAKDSLATVPYNKIALKGITAQVYMAGRCEQLGSCKNFTERF